MHGHVSPFFFVGQANLGSFLIIKDGQIHRSWQMALLELTRRPHIQKDLVRLGPRL